MSKNLSAVVIADEINVRFPFSGRITQVFKRMGDSVRKSEVLAQLDTKILQLELDRELAYYEKVRAQAELNSAVKAVELSKSRLDEAGQVCTPLPPPMLSWSWIPTPSACGSNCLLPNYPNLPN